MEIHKPKPWHGWREFLKEYLIVVIGVLTALGAEQAVESVHERRLSGEARASVREELNLNLTNVSQRWKFQPCVDKRIEDIGRILDKAENGEPFEAPLLIAQPQGFRSATKRWEVAAAAGRTSLLSSEEQEGFARVYTQLDLITKRQLEEELTWAHLLALEGHSRLSPQIIADARMALGEARVESAGIKRNLTRSRAYAEQLGIKGDATMAAMDRNYTFAICLPMNTKREDAVRLVGDLSALP